MDFKTIFLSELELNNMNYSDIGRYLNKNPSTVRAWVDKNAIPAADTALKLADCFGVSVRYLITGQKEKNDLTQEEKNLLALFRDLSSPDKKELLEIAQIKARKKENSFSLAASNINAG